MAMLGARRFSDDKRMISRAETLAPSSPSQHLLPYCRGCARHKLKCLNIGGAYHFLGI